MTTVEPADMPMKIVFLLSLPRSGSTLIQRILGSHADIATRTEPWLLLPLIYMTKETGVFAEYAHRHSSSAIRDFLGSFKGGSEAFDRSVREFTYSLYGNACATSEKYFLDKSPRYSLIADRLLEIFSEEKFIIIWRNPLAIIASMIKAWTVKDRFLLWGSITDLFKGFDVLYDAYTKNKDRFIAINYEDFVRDSETYLRIISDHLEIPYEQSILDSFNKTKLEGRYGDKKGFNQYASINIEVIDKWKEAIHNPFRKYWCKKYLRWIGRERLEVIGYSYDTLLQELDAIPNKKLYRTPVDIFYYFGGEIIRFFEPFILQYKFKNLRARKSRTAFLS